VRGLLPLGSLLLGSLLLSPTLPAQSLLERPANLQGQWSVPAGQAHFVFSHRFEFLAGGAELFNVPTLTLAVGLPLGLTGGLHFTSVSEIVASRLAANETELWLRRAWGASSRRAAAATLAWNRAARSLDGALGASARAGPVTVHAEGRAFSDRFGEGEAGVAAAGGAVVRFTPLLALAGDLGRALGHEGDAVWTAGVAIGIPASPHTLSLHATNGGASTLQGASRAKVIGPRSVRYGFAFNAPLGSGSQWLRIFRPAPPPEAPEPEVHRVEMRLVEYLPREIRIRAGETVEWINRDPIEHTVTGEGWGSELLQEGERFRHRFERPGTYAYLCLPHPMMRGVVVVTR
jgi:plastocyanin